MTMRETIHVDGVPISYLMAGKGGRLVLLLHGTYWSRVWQPVLDGIAAAGLCPVAVDFPGFGRSGGELTVQDASIPRLSDWLVRFLRALKHEGPVMVVGHDIGGGVAQHLFVSRAVDVPRLALVNAVMYNSMARPGRGPFPGPGRGRVHNDRRRPGGAPNIGDEGPWTSRKPSRDRGVSRSMERAARRAVVARARRRCGQPLHDGADARDAQLEDPKTSRLGRGRRIPDRRPRRTLRPRDAGNQARADQVRRPYSDGKRSRRRGRRAGRLLRVEVTISAGRMS